MEKSGIFVGHPVLDTGRDTGRDNGTARDSGQMDCPVVDNGTLDGLSSMGQWDTGRAILYWTEAARDSGHRGWTVDGTEWTEVLSLLWFTKSNSCLFLVDRRCPIISRGYKLSVQPCRVLPIKTAGYANGWTELRKTHIYIYIIYLYIFPLLLTPLYYIYIFFTVQIK